MTAPRRQSGRDVAKFAKACTDKRRYADEFAARAMAQETIRNGHAEKMWVYVCTGCRGWHTTRLNNGRKWAVTAEDLMPSSDPFAGLSK